MTSNLAHGHERYAGHLRNAQEQGGTLSVVILDRHGEGGVPGKPTADLVLSRVLGVHISFGVLIKLG